MSLFLSDPKNRARIALRLHEIGLDLVQLAIQYSLRTLFSPKVPQKYIPTTSIFLSRTIRLKAINKGGQSSRPITNTLIFINSQSISHNNLASLFERKLKFHQSSLFNYHPHLQFISSPSSPSDIRTIDEPHLPIEKTFRSVVNFETKTGSLETQRRGSFFCSISHSRDSHAKTSVSDNKGTSQGCLDIVRRCRLTGAERARNTRRE